MERINTRMKLKETVDIRDISTDLQIIGDLLRNPQSRGDVQAMLKKLISSDRKSATTVMTWLDQVIKAGTGAKL